MRASVREAGNDGVTDARLASHSKAKEMKCNPDDILDAVCLAVTAALKAAGKCETIPSDPDMDEKGLFIENRVRKLLPLQAAR